MLTIIIVFLVIMWGSYAFAPKKLFSRRERLGYGSGLALIGALIAFVFVSATGPYLDDLTETQPAYQVNGYALIVHGTSLWYYPDQTMTPWPFTKGGYLEDADGSPYLEITHTGRCQNAVTLWRLCWDGDTTYILHVPQGTKLVIPS